jgi:hypothetical protein
MAAGALVPVMAKLDPWLLVAFVVLMAAWPILWGLALACHGLNAS